MLAAIAGAQREVLLEMYWIGRDRTGESFRDALTERARAGVRVRVMYDAIGSFALDPGWWARLRADGGEVREFGPLSPFRRRLQTTGISFRDHRKILVVDGEIGFTGGINLADAWLLPGAPELSFRDDVVEVRGPVARELRAVFHEGWARCGGEDTASSPKVTRAAGARVCTIANRFGRKPDRAIRRAYLLSVRRARRTIDIAAAYFLPGPRLLHALRQAARRGVRVRLLIPRRSDVLFVDLATSSITGHLLEAGVRVFAYTGRVLHSKTAVIDGKFATIGSHNLDARSWRLNLECNLAVADPGFAGLMEASFERDLAHADELGFEAWKRRPSWLRALGWVAALFRPVL